MIKKGDTMRYTWRILCAFITIAANIINILYSGESLSLLIFGSLVFNLLIGWFVGKQLDRYHFSKKQLGSAKNALNDYSYALDSVADAIGITNNKGQFEFANEALANLYGYSRVEFSTLNWESCFTTESVDHLNKKTTTDVLKNGHWRGDTIGVKKDGTNFRQEITLSHIKETNKMIFLIRDITNQRINEEYMKFIAEHNELTKLPNRRQLLSDLNKIKIESTETSLLFIDLDRFKLANDTLGHDIGDELLKNVAERLTSFKKDYIKIYHLGGDEFIVLIQNTNVDYVKKIASKIVNSIREPFTICGNEITITTSIGISCYPDHTNNLNELVKLADTAMYYAKIDGKNAFKFFTNDLKLQLDRRALIEAELRKAIKNEDLFINYQPKFNLVNSQLTGFEALIRWEHPKLGSISPQEFIPVAEDTGLIIDIGNWIIKEVIFQLRKWQDKGYRLEKTSINISQRQFRDHKLPSFIDLQLKKYHINPEYMEIEITESVLEDFELVVPQLHTLKELGVGISLDDFGTGYSSLNLLKTLPIDTLKIDQSFVRNSLGDSKDISLLKTILQIGDNLNLNVVAEGIETAEHLHLLKNLGCPIGQGYYFSKPLSTSEVEEAQGRSYSGQSEVLHVKRHD